MTSVYADNLVRYHMTMDKHSITGSSIALQSVSKSWADQVALDNISFEVPAGSFTVLLGPSGCGKSTSLRIVAGLEFADSGSVTIGERDVSQIPPVKRDIAMVFQSYALFPHLNVAENILFGLKVRRVDSKEQKQRLHDTATMLGLSDYLSRKPSQLSGGQQQRVALGRAIIAEKPVCLMDEPLSNLDAKLRNSMRMEIRDLQQKLGFTMVYVTHDQVEAITMADQVVLMREGRIEQCGSPREIYEQPSSSFVAGFIGTPPMNLLSGASLQRNLQEQSNVPADQTMDNIQEYTLGVRPEHVRLSDSSGISATVQHVEYLGSDVLADCQLGDTSLLARVDGSAQLAIGDQVNLSWSIESTHFFDNDTGYRLDPERSHQLRNVGF